MEGSLYFTKKITFSVAVTYHHILYSFSSIYMYKAVQIVLIIEHNVDDTSLDIRCTLDIMLLFLLTVVSNDDP